MKARALLAVCACFCMLGLANVVRADQITFSDGNFASADWSLYSYTWNDGGGVTATRVLTGGNGDNGPFRQVRAYVASNSTILGFNQSLASVYTPSTQGAITSVDFSIDEKLLSASAGAYFFGAALLQDNNVYMHPVGADLTPTWGTLSSSGLDQYVFYKVAPDLDPTGGTILDVSSHPNFGPTGSTIHFGFYTANAAGVLPGGVAVVAGHDNWSMTVHNVVPEPSTLAALAGLAGLGMVAVVRRRIRPAR